MAKVWFNIVCILCKSHLPFLHRFICFQPKSVCLFYHFSHSPPLAKLISVEAAALPLGSALRWVGIHLHKGVFYPLGLSSPDLMINLDTCMFYISHLFCFWQTVRHLVRHNVAHISADKPTPDVQVSSFFILPFRSKATFFPFIRAPKFGCGFCFNR